MIDLIIIGAGPGGLDAALYADSCNLSVCLIEKDTVGGVCLNNGCIPTKTLYYATKNIDSFKKLEEYGIDVSYNFSYEKLFNKKCEVINELKKGIEFKLSKSNIRFINGNASIIDNNKVKVNDEIIEAKNIIIASGSMPLKGLIKGDEHAISSTELLNTNSLFDSLTIIGGGVIGMEMACIYSKLNVKVNVIELADNILPTLDSDVSKRLQVALSKSNIKFYTKSKVESILSPNEVKIISKGKEEVITSDKILVSIGRMSNIIDSNIEIKTSTSGYVVDENFMTSVNGIYAIGDCNGKMRLAHYATYSGLKVVDHIINKQNVTNFDLVPSCIFITLEVATVGKTESMLKNENIDYVVIKKMYRSNGKAVSMNCDGYCKMLVKDDLLLGATIVGEGASTLIHELTILMNKNIKLSEFNNYIYAHPTLSEILKS